MRRCFRGFAGALRGIAASTSDLCSEVGSCPPRVEMPSAPPKSRVRLVMIHRSAYPRPARLLPVTERICPANRIESLAALKPGMERVYDIHTGYTGIMWSRPISHRRNGVSVGDMEMKCCNVY